MTSIHFFVNESGQYEAPFWFGLAAIALAVIATSHYLFRRIVLNKKQEVSICDDDFSLVLLVLALVCGVFSAGGATMTRYYANCEDCKLASILSSDKFEIKPFILGGVTISTNTNMQAVTALNRRVEFIDEIIAIRLTKSQLIALDKYVRTEHRELVAAFDRAKDQTIIAQK